MSVYVFGCMYVSVYICACACVWASVCVCVCVPVWGRLCIRMSVVIVLLCECVFVGMFFVLCSLF